MEIALSDLVVTSTHVGCRVNELDMEILVIILLKLSTLNSFTIDFFTSNSKLLHKLIKVLFVFFIEVLGGFFSLGFFFVFFELDSNLVLFVGFSNSRSSEFIKLSIITNLFNS